MSYLNSDEHSLNQLGIDTDTKMSARRADAAVLMAERSLPRIWPTAMARAIKERDQQCVWPGCTQSRHLHFHHLQHWADGLVHEGGYTTKL